MKRNIDLCLISLLLLCIASACSKSDESEKKTFNFSLGNVTPMAASGQSSESFTFSSGDTLGLFLKSTAAESTTATTQLSNSYCAYTDGRWSLEQPVIFEESQQNDQLALDVYYPYNTKFVNTRNIGFNIQADQSTEAGLKASDFMCGSASTTVSACSSLPVQLSHMLSRIVVNINYVSSEIEHCKEVRLRVHSSCTINMATGDVVTSTAYANVNGYLTSSGAAKQQVVFIIPPQYLSKNYPIEFVYANKEFSITVNQEFKSGEQYTLDFTSYGDDQLTYNGVTVEEWNKVSVTQGKLISSGDIGADLTTGDAIVYSTGTGKKPVTIVVTGDGYTADDMAREGTFESAARKALDYLFSVEPFKTYRSYFSVYIIAAVSNESGSTNNSTGKKRDTYFGTGWSDDYSDMAVKDADQLFNFVKKYCPDIQEGKTTIENTGVYVLINDDRYGGITHSYSNGKNYAIIPTIQGALKWSSNDPENAYYTGDWANVFLHECGGHGFGRLLDEYYYSSYGTYPSSRISSQYWSVPFGLNMTLDYNNTQGTVYWKHLLDRDDYPRVGFYEGGAVYTKGIWRSEVISGMCDNRPYFNAISRQLIVERIMQLAGETFSQNDWYEKDVKIDPVRDSNNSGVQKSNDEKSAILCPQLPPPVLEIE